MIAARAIGLRRPPGLCIAARTWCETNACPTALALCRIAAGEAAWRTGGYARRDARGMSGRPELVMTRAGAATEPRAGSCSGMNGVKAAAPRAAGVESAAVETTTVEAASASMKAP
ncbi:hypothetical protein H8B02_40170, partial [Bradyrhizobium sp. Pear77]|uniref:hypothetical protein n=1 Tax=Bradyrhizobium altum TaxID=1571202 RepID=UPI001E29E13F